MDNTCAYPGVPETLAQLSQFPMAVLTNKPERISVRILNSLGLANYFRVIYGGNSFSTKKPQPEGARKLLDENGVRAEEAVVVGDSHVDISTGRNAGMWTIGVTYGFAPHTLLDEPPDVLVDSPAEVARSQLSWACLPRKGSSIAPRFSPGEVSPLTSRRQKNSPACS